MTKRLFENYGGAEQGPGGMSRKAEGRPASSANGACPPTQWIARSGPAQARQRSQTGSKRPPKIPTRGQASRARLVAIFLDKVVWHCRVLGREHIPDGPVILAGNHTGLMDGPVVIGATPRGTHFLVKQELTKGLLGKVMSAAGQVPVDRSDGSQALQVCLQLLERGQIVGIFPEGTRGDGRMDRIHAGVGWLAVHSGAPVVPFACLGTRRQGEAVGKIPPFRRRMLVEFGPAIELDLASTTNTRQQVTASLVPIAQGLAAHVAAVVDRTGLKLPTDSGRKDQR